MSEVREHREVYIGGRWVPSTGTDTIEVRNPTTEDVIATVPAGTPADVDAAVAAAREAFEPWSALAPAERAGWLRKAQQALSAAAGEMAEVITADVGVPRRIASAVQVGLPMFNLGHFADLADSFDPMGSEVGNSLVVHEPVGVVGAITPWNYPLHQVVLKVAPALAAGCTVVLKPTEIAPLSIYAFVQLLDDIGLPAGVVNMVSGYGVPVGEAIASHPGIDMVSFTGSLRAGSRVAELAAPTVKRVALELGGKSANVLLDDADLTKAITDGVGKCFLNSGQTCSALTRMLVPADRLAEAEEIVTRVAESFRVGDPTDATTKLGPLVSAAQLARVRGYIQRGISDGARLLTGGADPVSETGFFVAPTVLSGVTPEMTVAREEIFGPVLVLMPYTDEDDAVRIANATDYGLAGGVWSGDPERALRVARRLRTGQVEINGGAFNPAAPFGGYRQSGVGREGGTYGLAEFLEVKAIQR